MVDTVNGVTDFVVPELKLFSCIEIKIECMITIVDVFRLSVIPDILRILSFIIVIPDMTEY